MSIGGLPALNDGNNARAVLYNRLIEQYNVQMFISAGNDGAGVNTVGDPAVATKVMSVGSYITEGDAGRRTTARTRRFVDNLHAFTLARPARGRRLQAADRRSRRGRLDDADCGRPGGPVGGTYTLPPGYACSTAPRWPRRRRPAPRRCSSARPSRAGVQTQPAQLRQALTSSARCSTRAAIEAYEQGNGLIDVGAAWNLLQDEHQDRRHHVVGAGQHAAERVPRDARRRRGHLRPRGRDRRARATRAQYTFTRTSGGGRRR